MNTPGELIALTACGVLAVLWLAITDPPDLST